MEALRTQHSALRYMKDRRKPPKQKDVTQLPGGGEFKVGQFWRACKRKRRCSGQPYIRLLDNAVLGADYRVHRGGAACQEIRAEAAQREGGGATD